MAGLTRRQFLKGSTAVAGATLLYPQIVRALSLPARVQHRSIEDVEHVVILMQENRSFDHYFGTMPGVRGFSDPYPAPARPLASYPERNVFTQLNSQHQGPELITPFPLNTQQNFAHMRVEGTPHAWPDAQYAWDNGRMDQWPNAKQLHSMGYFEQQDIPFQFALANAFTLCDAYHCSFQGGTNPNRLFLWSGTNDGQAKHGGPAVGNSHDRLASDGGDPDSYHWATYPERLSKAGIEWTIYQDMQDNFTDNPLVGFQSYRNAAAKGEANDLRQRALTTRTLAHLKQDVMADRLPAVSYIIATAEGSEHPGPSSPAQGAAYTAEMLEALTSNPEVWAKTVVFIMFDENDGFFDHVPPPAPPSPDPHRPGHYFGHSQVATTGEYHRTKSDNQGKERDALIGQPYGLGPRVPAYVVSPWSRGGNVCSEVMDHTSVIRFLELRFGVAEPNISPWRRAVCGDFMSAFDFVNPNKDAFPHLPEPYQDALRAGQLDGRTVPPIPSTPSHFQQEPGEKPHRPCLYNIEVVEEDKQQCGDSFQLTLRNTTARAVVIHIYDRLNLDAVPRRYTVAGHQQLQVSYAYHQGHYDLQLMGPEGFHRRLQGQQDMAHHISLKRQRNSVQLFTQTPELLYRSHCGASFQTLPMNQAIEVPLTANRRYDLQVKHRQESFIREFAGRLP